MSTPTENALGERVAIENTVEALSLVSAVKKETKEANTLQTRSTNVDKQQLGDNKGYEEGEATPEFEQQAEEDSDQNEETFETGESEPREEESLHEQITADSDVTSKEMEVEKAFRHYDKDNSGEMEAIELAELCEELGKPLSEASFSKALALLDQDQSGKISLHEFSNWYLGINEEAESNSELAFFRREVNKEHHIDIHVACWEGDLETVKSFLSLDKTLVNLPDKTEFGMGYRPLHYACFQGNLDLANLLLSNGANPNARTDEGCTALFFASQQGHEQVVKHLLKQGARVDIPEKKHGLSALEVAGDPQVRQTLESFCVSTPPEPLSSRPCASVESPGLVLVTWQYDQGKSSAVMNGRALPIKTFWIRLVDEGDSTNVICESHVLGDESSCTFAGISHPKPLVALVSPATSIAQGDWSMCSEPVCAVYPPHNPQAPTCRAVSRSSVEVVWKQPTTRGVPVTVYELQLQTIIPDNTEEFDALGRCAAENNHLKSNDEPKQAKVPKEDMKWKFVGKFPKNITRTTVTGLSSCTKYRARLVAHSRAGPSKPSRPSEPVKTKGMPIKAKKAINRLMAVRAFGKLV